MKMAARSAKPNNGVAPHFINRAARIAFFILGHSAGSGRMGRMVCRLTESLPHIARMFLLLVRGVKPIAARMCNGNRQMWHR